MTPFIIFFIVIVFASITLFALKKGSAQQDPLQDFLKDKRSKNNYSK